jgi:hypothetical protein
MQQVDKQCAASCDLWLAPTRMFVGWCADIECQLERGY